LKTPYETQAEQLAQAIDIATEAFKTYPPKDWSESNIQHVIKVHLDWKEMALNPKPAFKNKKSLAYLINDTFTYFQESSGKTVEYFWQEVVKHNLPFKRENKLSKILKRKRIKNDIEYDFITDVFVPYRQGGLITEDEVTLLNELLAQYEAKNKTT
jgi:hypothetical protein